MWRSLCTIAIILPPAHCFRDMVFNAVSGHVAVSAADYLTVTILDKRHPWTRIAVLMSRYMMTKKEHYGNRELENDSDTTRLAITAKKVSQTHIMRFKEEFIASGQIHTAAKSILAHYTLTENTLVEKVLSVRTDLLSSLGTLALKVGEELEKKRSQLEGSEKTLDPMAQNTIAATAMHGKLAEIEATYRSQLAALMKCTVTDLKDAVYTKATEIQPACAPPPVEPSGISAHMSPVLVIAICDAWLTFLESRVASSLQPMASQVMARMNEFIKYPNCGWYEQSAGDRRR